MNFISANESEKYQFTIAPLKRGNNEKRAGRKRDLITKYKREYKSDLKSNMVQVLIEGARVTIVYVVV